MAGTDKPKLTKKEKKKLKKEKKEKRLMKAGGMYYPDRGGGMLSRMIRGVDPAHAGLRLSGQPYLGSDVVAAYQDQLAKEKLKKEAESEAVKEKAALEFEHTHGPNAPAVLEKAFQLAHAISNQENDKVKQITDQIRSLPTQEAIEFSRETGAPLMAPDGRTLGEIYSSQFGGGRPEGYFTGRQSEPQAFKKPLTNTFDFTTDEGKQVRVEHDIAGNTRVIRDGVKQDWFATSNFKRDVLAAIGPVKNPGTLDDADKSFQGRTTRLRYALEHEAGQVSPAAKATADIEKRPEEKWKYGSRTTKDPIQYFGDEQTRGTVAITPGKGIKIKTRKGDEVERKYFADPSDPNFIREMRLAGYGAKGIQRLYNEFYHATPEGDRKKVDWEKLAWEDKASQVDYAGIKEIRPEYVKIEKDGVKKQIPIDHPFYERELNTLGYSRADMQRIRDQAAQVGKLKPGEELKGDRIQNWKSWLWGDAKAVGRAISKYTPTIVKDVVGGVSDVVGYGVEKVRKRVAPTDEEAEAGLKKDIEGFYERHARGETLGPQDRQKLNQYYGLQAKKVLQSAAAPGNEELLREAHEVSHGPGTHKNQPASLQRQLAEFGYDVNPTTANFASLPHQSASYPFPVRGGGAGDTQLTSAFNTASPMARQRFLRDWMKIRHGENLYNDEESVGGGWTGWLDRHKHLIIPGLNDLGRFAVNLSHNYDIARAKWQDQADEDYKATGGVGPHARPGWTVGLKEGLLTAVGEGLHQVGTHWLGAPEKASRTVTGHIVRGIHRAVNGDPLMQTFIQEYALGQDELSEQAKDGADWIDKAQAIIPGAVANLSGLVGGPIGAALGGLAKPILDFGIGGLRHFGWGKSTRGVYSAIKHLGESAGWAGWAAFHPEQARVLWKAKKAEHTLLDMVLEDPPSELEKDKEKVYNTMKNMAHSAGDKIKTVSTAMVDKTKSFWNTHIARDPPPFHQPVIPVTPIYTTPPNAVTPNGERGPEPKVIQTRIHPLKGFPQFQGEDGKWHAVDGSQKTNKQGVHVIRVNDTWKVAHGLEFRGSDGNLYRTDGRGGIELVPGQTRLSRKHGVNQTYVKPIWRPWGTPEGQWKPTPGTTYVNQTTLTPMRVERGWWPSNRVFKVHEI
jgi:hypothetical protein